MEARGRSRKLRDPKSIYMQEAESKQEMEQDYAILRPTPNDILPPVRSHLLKGTITSPNRATSWR